MYIGRKLSLTFAVEGPGAGALVRALWRAPYAGKVIAVYAFRNGGSGAVVNARIGANPLRAADISLTTADVWAGGVTNVVDANQRFAAGDTISAAITSTAGSPTYVRIQVDIELASTVN